MELTQDNEHREGAHTLARMQRSTKPLTDFHSSSQVLCTLEGLRGTCSNEVIQVMEEVWNLVGIDKDPLHHVERMLR